VACSQVTTPSMINPESNLKAEYENALVFDYRDPKNPNNEVVVTCEHATNDLPDEYSWSENDTKYFKNEHWGVDIGALKMAKAIAAELKCVLVQAIYSRLLLDANRTILSDTLFRKGGDGQVVELNKDMTYEEEQKRIQKYFIPYYEAVRDISLKVDPLYVLSIHSFTPLYQGEIREMEIGVLHGHESVTLSNDLHEGMKTKFKSVQNSPYDGISTMGAVKSLIFAKNPTRRQGITFEFRNDLLQSETIYPELRDHTVQVCKKACKLI